MEINQEHVVSFVTGALSFWAVLKAIAGKTKTTKDDELVQAGQDVHAWAEKRAAVIWPLVELAAQTGKVPQGVAKAIYALELLKKAWGEANKSEMPRKCEEAAQQVWAVLSVTEKESRHGQTN